MERACEDTQSERVCRTPETSSSELLLSQSHHVLYLYLLYLSRVLAFFLRGFCSPPVTSR